MFKEVTIEQLRANGSVVLYWNQEEISFAQPKSRFSRKIISLGIGLFGLFLCVSPMLSSEIGYRLSTPATQVIAETRTSTIPVEQFSLNIPKINLNAPVLPNIDPYNEKEYAESLKKGLAHAKGTSFPGQGETIYIFGHSSSFAWDNNPYGTAFYLLNKLDKTDKIFITYNQKLYIYQVSEKKIVNSADFSLLSLGKSEKLVLQTCWPPASNWKRLVVIAEPLDTLTYK